MNKGNLASLPASLLLILGLCLALMPTTAQATKLIPADSTIGTWDSTNRIYTLAQDVSEGIKVTENSLTLDGAGYTVTGPGSGIGVYLYERIDVTIRNLTVQSFDCGIYLNSSTNNILQGNTVSSNGDGIYLNTSTGNTIYNNYFNNASNFLFGGTIYSNTWNTTKTSGTNIVGGPYLGGNFWAKPDDTGFSQTHPDTDGADSATRYIPLLLTM